SRAIPSAAPPPPPAPLRGEGAGGTMSALDEQRHHPLTLPSPRRGEGSWILGVREPTTSPLLPEPREDAHQAAGALAKEPRRVEPARRALRGLAEGRIGRDHLGDRLELDAGRDR